MSGNDLHPITAEYQHHTDMALCVKIGRQEYWFPLATVETEPLINYERGDDIALEVQEWLLVKHGLDYLVEA